MNADNTDPEKDDRHTGEGDCATQVIGDAESSNIGKSKRTALPLHYPDQHRNADDDPVDGERRKAPLADPVHEPCHHGQCHDEGNHEADDENGPLMAANGHAAQGFCAVFGMKSLEQVIAGGGDHGGHR
jgi:hypothetical protein